MGGRCSSYCGSVVYYVFTHFWGESRVRPFAVSVVLPVTSKTLFAARTICCLKLCGGLCARDERATCTASVGARGPPLSIVVITGSTTRRLRRGLPFVLRRSCPRFRIVIVCSHPTSSYSGALGLLRSGCPGLCRAFVPSDTHCVDRGGLKVAVKVGTDHRR